MPRSRVTRCLCAAALVLGVLASSATASTAQAQAPSGPDGRTLAPGSREARAVGALDRAGSILQGRARGDATMALRDLALLKGSLSGADRDAAERLLARPDAPQQGEPGAYAAGDVVTTDCSNPAFCLHYTTTAGSKSAVTPGFVTEAAAAVSHVHDTYVAAGYRAPEPDAGQGGTTQTDIYLVDLPEGLYGYCTTDQDVPRNGPHDVWAYCVVDNDYSRQEFPTNTPVENLQVTVAHEYFHAVQFAYDIDEDQWFMEATATWAEDELYDAVDDNVQYLRASPLGEPRRSMDTGGGGEVYGDWIFFRYLSERDPAEEGGLPTIVRDFWRAADSSAGAPDRYSLRAITTVLAQRGDPLSPTFARFADGNRRPDRTYAEGRVNRYPEARLWDTSTLTPQRRATPWDSVDLDHLTSATARFTPSAALRSRGWKVRVQLDMADKRRGSVAVVSVTLASGRVRTAKVRLDRRGDGSTTVAFSHRTVRFVEVTLANASGRFDCDRGTPFSCTGEPKDDDLTQRVRATALR